ncbi:polysaccharide pyruvyl transferase family protein [Bifidobacterium tissieri]|uniref:polysaccharide pyruvyl transferase family protein n=1 Tax=Bifidobacterium tissieri TaxID=1630162 RepID=UPI00123B799E|nr:polysaccharide pyruvyl transferase family protein [Bifidobacterium tissieri]KAA8831322.1 hypothetical protein EM849_07515 [Bifidobacterium tissieri]
MSTSQNKLFRYTELAIFRMIGAYRMGWLFDRVGMRRGAQRAKSVGKPETFSILLGETPLYRNIGDLAIAVAQESYLERIDLGEVREYVENDRWEALSYYRRTIPSNAVIVLQGGGNMGERYFGLDLKRAGVVEAFPNNRIVIMPQTSDYNGTLGDALLRYMRSVYRKHGDVHLFARERRSYELMKRQFPDVDVQLTTDIVMTYHPEFDESQIKDRHGALIVLRKDGEKLVEGDGVKSIVVDELTQLFGNDRVRFSDTIFDRSVTLDERRKVVLDKLSEFANAEIVVTDRLHGMIFSAITGTPCVAFDNANHKVSESYNAWLKEYAFIKLATPDTFADVLSDVVNASSMESPSYDYESMMERCGKIRDAIKECVSR